MKGVIDFDIRLDPSYRQVQRWIRTMPDQVVNKAQVRTLNRMAKVAETHAARAIGKGSGLKIGYVKKWIRQDKARRGRHMSRIRIASQIRVPLTAWRPRSGTVRKNGRTYQTARFSKSYIKQYVQRTGQADKIFPASMKSGHSGVYRRKGAARLPIITPPGPKMGFLWRRFAVQKVKQELSRRYAPEMEKNLNFYMTRHRARR